MRRFADIGAAVIGTGFIGTVHVEALRRIGVDVRGVLGSTPDRGAARAAALNVPKAYGSLDEILAAGLVRVAEAAGLVNAVNFNNRFYPLHQHVREIIAAFAAT